MEYHDVMRIIEVFCQNGDVQTIQPVGAEDRFVLQVSPEHSVLQETSDFWPPQIQLKLD